MRKFSVVIQQVLVNFAVLVLPAILLFLSYANSITDSSTRERENAVQRSLQYVNQTFGLLADTAHSEAVRISASEDYITAVTDFQYYDQVIQNVDLQDGVQSIAHRLATVQFADERLRNIYLYTLNTDYVITSDRGLLRFKNLKDSCWLDSYKAYTESAYNYRIPLWMGRTAPESDLLSNGSRDRQTPVISYILPVRIANARSISLLVMNYYETQIAKLINVDEESQVYIVDAHGKVICHPNLSQLGEDFSEKLNLSSILSENSSPRFYYSNKQGFFLLFANDHVLYSYLPTDVGNWVLVNENQLHAFTKEIGFSTKAYFAVFILLILLGTMFCLHATRRIIAPIAKLSKKLNLPNVHNEILLIEREIQRLQKREQELVNSVQLSSSDVHNLYLLSLLRDMPWSQTLPFEWPCDGFTVIVLAIDKASAAQFNSTILLLEAKKVFSSVFYTEAITLDARTCILIVNMNEENDVYGQIERALLDLRKQLKHTECSFTAGIGLYQTDESNISESYRQAGIAARQRLLHGYGREILYNKTMSLAQFNCASGKYGTMIINALEAANINALENALKLLRIEMEKLNADGVFQTMNQLINMIGTWLFEKHAVDDIFEDGMQAWYAEESVAETIDELLTQLYRRAQAIINYFEEEKNEQDYIAQMLSYIDEHYMDDIDFEEVSKNVGISYSYARRIMKQKTNRTLLETMNAVRIQHAKQLLRDEPALTVKDIAASVGYHNIQSFNRFFKKSEMVTPSEYREHSMPSTSSQTPEV